MTCAWGETGRELLAHGLSSPVLELTYVDGSLLLVSSQDPDLNVSLHQCLNSLGDVILQLVLDRGGSEQLQVLQQRSGTSWLSIPNQFHLMGIGSSLDMPQSVGQKGSGAVRITDLSFYKYSDQRF